jgi:hypothetical protein
MFKHIHKTNMYTSVYLFCKLALFYYVFKNTLCFKAFNVEPMLVLMLISQGCLIWRTAYGWHPNSY